MSFLQTVSVVIPTVNSSSLSPFHSTRNHSSLKHRVRQCGFNRNRNRNHYLPFRFRSAASNGDRTRERDDSINEDEKVGGADHSSLPKFDRRDLLFGLGGIYGAAAFDGGNSNRSAMASPIITPNIGICKDSTITDPATKEFLGKINCCPPVPDTIIDFTLPILSGKPRVRRPAHLLNPKEIEKFERAIQAMKDLPESDPRNFYQQANIHCAYCNGAYEQEGYTGIELQVHENWHFYPFHRIYLYFYERILGSLIDDPTFALPFWNWDSSAGMEMPAIYDNPKSSLYDEKRNQKHRRPTRLDLNYDGTNDDPDPSIIEANLATVYKQMVTNSKTSQQFFGQVIRGGEKLGENGSGAIENTPHNNLHFWGGDPRQDFNEDMGNFYSSGRDILFYAHHANIDRMWNIWKSKLNGKDFTDTDWLDTSFVFYDENRVANRIKVRDCIDSNKLGYEYEDVSSLEWIDKKPTPARPKTVAKAKRKLLSSPLVKFPVTLNSIVTVPVNRPKKSRSRKNKDEFEELLVIEGIQFNRSLGVHFDVLVNAGDDVSDITPKNTEFAGSFSRVPIFHEHGGGAGMDDMKELPKTSLILGLTDLIDDLDLDDKDSVLVTLVPKLNGDKITIGGISIKFVRLKIHFFKDEEIGEEFLLK